MSKRYVLEQEQRIARPLADVFAFFSDAANLERITPPTLRFQILTPQPIAMKAGAIIDYQLRLFGVPFRWRTVIEDFQPGVRFVDSQARGPYKLWRHTHEFREENGETVMRDRVEYELPLGPLGRVAHAIAVKAQLADIFAHRRKVVDDVFRRAA
jgi:ligand-binding SRPBCC domain-containing protein